MANEETPEEKGAREAREAGERTRREIDGLISRNNARGGADGFEEGTVKRSAPLSFASLRAQIEAAISAAEKEGGRPNGFIFTLTRATGNGFTQQLTGGSFENPGDAVETSANMIETILPALISSSCDANGIPPGAGMAMLASKVGDAIRRRFMGADGVPEFRPLDAPCPIHGDGPCPEFPSERKRRPRLSAPAEDESAAPSAKDLENLLLFPKKPLPEC